ncbi:E3 SUMO-protein ligase pli1 [Lecanora helva]
MASALSANAEQVVAKVKTLINNQLKQILKKEGLPSSGVKATLQQRIIDQLYHYGQDNNLEGFSRLRSLVLDPGSDPNALCPSPSVARPYSQNPQTSPNQYQSSFTSTSYKPGTTNMTSNSSSTGQRSPQFKQSPFYSVVEPLTPVLECKVRDTTRDTVESTINLRSDLVERLSKDGALKAMIYCAAEATYPFSRVDIEFPYQVEIKINQDELKANLRGLKNKPGTTRPADITSLLRQKAGYNNYMLVTYALTKKVGRSLKVVEKARFRSRMPSSRTIMTLLQKYFLVVNLVKCHPVDELVAKLKSGKTIAKDQVIREMISRAEDADIVATSSIMSLKCPLSTLRIEVPCRSSICSHNQCFDAKSFLQLQEQAPTWTCPVCNKAVGYEHLQVDQYVDDILKATPKSVEQITIEPSGKWLQTPGNVPSPPRTSNGSTSTDGEEDLVEIKDFQFASVKSEVPRDPGLLRTPPFSSREQSISSLAPPSLPTSINKRQASQLVDLTLSSEEDEDPPRPAKISKPSSQFPKLVNSAPLRPNGVPRPHPSNSLPTSNQARKDFVQPF